MAILDAVPGIEVTVCIDGKPLDEYEDDVQEEVKPGHVGEWQAARTVSKYVTSESEKQFSIRIKVDRSYNMDSPGLGFPITIDGKWMGSPCLTETSHPHAYNSLHRNYVRDDYGTVGKGENGDSAFLRRYKFSGIETTTDDEKLADLKKDLKTIEEVGEIRILVYRHSASGPAAATTAGSTATESQRSAKVHEKALKGQAKSHSTSLGNAEATTTTWIKVDRLDGNDFPIAIFRFKYRSREALKQLLIIERTPSPEPERARAPPSAVNVGSLNAEQKAQLERFMAGLVGNNSAGPSDRPIKRERGNDEGSGPLRKKRKSGEKITIDLTEDSDEENVIALV